MINLLEQSGLEIYLKDDGYLEFGENILFNPPEQRLFSEAKSFFRDPNVKVKNDLLYLMYRNVRRKDDDKLLIANDIRYDLTVIFPGALGEEYNKTIGHYHPLKTNTQVSFPEVYEVIYGNAKMIIQELNWRSKQLNNVYFVNAKEGDKIVIPSKENFAYGHTTINATNNFLILANIQERSFKSDYSEYLNKRGASYYLLNIKEGGTFEKNLKYNFALKPIKLTPVENSPELCLSKHNPLYLNLIKNIDTFKRYLTFPENYLTILSIDNCFTVSQS